MFDLFYLNYVSGIELEKVSSCLHRRKHNTSWSLRLFVISSAGNGNNGMFQVF